MPRLLVDKIWRAFPELDRFPDSECRRFVQAAKAGAGCRLVLTPVLLGLVTVPVGFILISAIAALADRFGLTDSLLPGGILAMVVVLLVLLPCVVGLIARDHLLRSAVRARIFRAACPKCGFSLLGLAAHDNAVRCPECGTDIHLPQLGLRPMDLLPSSSGRDLRRAIDQAVCDCGFSLAGLPAPAGVVRCPECGNKRIFGASAATPARDPGIQ